MNNEIHEIAGKLSSFLLQPIRFQNYEIKILNLSIITHKCFKSIQSDAHNFFEFNYVMDGQLYTTINDKEFFVDTGCAFLVPPRCKHSHRNFENLEYTDFYIAFTINPIVPENSESFEDIFSSLFIPFSGTFNPKFESMVFSDDMYVNQLSFISWLMSVTGQMSIISNTKCPSVPKYISDRVIHYLNEHYKKKLDVYELAESMNMSYGYLSRLFRAETGTTIVAELKSIRMEHAKRLLLTTDLNVCEIAYMCGYDNEQYFQRVFNGYVHMSPLKFRKKNIY